MAAIAFDAAFFPSWYFMLVAVGHGLLLPAIATLHVRHRRVKESGAVLGTAAGTASVCVGIAAAASTDLVVASLFVRGIWWWTIGKVWAETRVLPRPFGVATMALAALAIGTALATAPLGGQTGAGRMAERLVPALWSLALATMLWRARRATASRSAPGASSRPA